MAYLGRTAIAANFKDVLTSKSFRGGVFSIQCNHLLVTLCMSRTPCACCLVAMQFANWLVVEFILMCLLVVKDFNLTQE